MYLNAQYCDVRLKCLFLAIEAIPYRLAASHQANRAWSPLSWYFIQFNNSFLTNPVSQYLIFSVSDRVKSLDYRVKLSLLLLSPMWRKQLGSRISALKVK